MHPPARWQHWIRQFHGLRLTRAFGLYALVAGLAFGLDRLTKALITSHMHLYDSWPLLGNVLKLTYVRNPGAAFSFLAHHNAPWRLTLFIVIAIMASVFMTITALLEQSKGWRLMIPLGLITGGALGNMIDRLQAGTVIDFIEFSYRSFYFPIFNAADSAVVVGVGWLIVLSFFSSSSTSSQAPPQS
jgi:signal peptidase II